MTGKELTACLKLGRAYIKGISQIRKKPEDIHREGCDIYGEDKMSYRTICRWAG